MTRKTTVLGRVRRPATGEMTFFLFCATLDRCSAVLSKHDDFSPIANLQLTYLDKQRASNGQATSSTVIEVTESLPVSSPLLTCLLYIGKEDPHQPNLPSLPRFTRTAADQPSCRHCYAH